LNCSQQQHSDDGLRLNKE